MISAYCVGVEGRMRRVLLEKDSGLLMTDSDIEDSGGEGAERINTDRITANRMLMLG